MRSNSTPVAQRLKRSRPRLRCQEAIRQQQLPTMTRQSRWIPSDADVLPIVAMRTAGVIGRRGNRRYDRAITLDLDYADAFRPASPTLPSCRAIADYDGDRAGSGDAVVLHNLAMRTAGVIDSTRQSPTMIGRSRSIQTMPTPSIAEAPHILRRSNTTGQSPTMTSAIALDSSDAIFFYNRGRAYRRERSARCGDRRFRSLHQLWILMTPTHSTIAASPTTPRNNTTAQSPTMTRRSGSIRNWPWRWVIAATPTGICSNMNVRLSTTIKRLNWIRAQVRGNGLVARIITRETSKAAAANLMRAIALDDNAARKDTKYAILLVYLARTRAGEVVTAELQDRTEPPEDQGLALPGVRTLPRPALSRRDPGTCKQTGRTMPGSILYCAVAHHEGRR